MKEAHAIYWYLWWDFSINDLNKKVGDAYGKLDFEQVKFYCKIIAVKHLGLSSNDFWNKYVMGK